jgi:prophage tail gpP-like protein
MARAGDRDDATDADRARQERLMPVTDGTRAHVVSIVIGDKQVDGWIDYEIACSMVQPADGFRLTRAFDLAAWELCRPDERIRVLIDGTPRLDGFIDDRGFDATEGTMEITGRDKSGRLVQESIPTVSGFDGLKLTDAIAKLAKPWFTTITLSDARNRNVSRGKGKRAAAENEDAFFKVKGKLDGNHAGRVDPGETRWNMIEQLCSSVGILCWASVDGRELVVGTPNYNQGIQYVFRHSRLNGSTVKDLRLRESVRDRYALIEVHGAGAGDADNFGGNVTTYAGIAKDGPNVDGTGKDFLRPKRLAVSQSAQQSNLEAKRAAEREMNRRNFSARQITVVAAGHGQIVAGTTPTLYTTNTLARVIVDDLDMDEAWLVYACTFRGSRQGAEVTEMMLVPRGTVFVS